MFLTTDAAYNVWHLAFDKILRETEQQKLLPVLEDMVGRASFPSPGLRRRSWPVPTWRKRRTG